MSSSTVTTANPARKVLLIGATGSIGSIILQALLASPDPISITVLKRAASTSPLPPSVPVITVPSYDAPTSTLTPIFRGFDVIISCQTTLSVSSQLNLIDAAVQAGVTRFFPSEYGLNNMRADAQALCPVFNEKGTIQRYLRDRQDQMEWTSISCGTWLKWAFQNKFLGIDVKGRKAKYWDDGEGRFSINTEESTALAVARAVTTHWEETRNRNVFLSEVVTSQRDLVEEVERQIGGGNFEVEKVETEGEVVRLRERFEGGEVMAVVGLIEAGLASGKYGTDFDKEEDVMTERLGLARRTLGEMVADALAGLE